MNRIDLHIHTTASDGVFNLKEVVKEAKKIGVKAIAITDHDTINPDLTDRIQIIDGIEVVTGTEIKCHYDGIRMEMHGYFIDPNDNELGEIFEEIQENRIGRIKKIVGKFNSLDEGAKLDWRDIVESANDSPGRPHVAREMVRKGAVDNFREAFDKYIGDDKECYVRMERPEYSKLLDKIHKSGGIAVLAHPASRKFGNVGEDFRRMKERGIDGVEVFYDYSDFKDLENDPEEIKGITKKLNLLKTGGSDFHNKEDYEMGKPKIDYKYLEKMKERLKI